MRQDGTGQPAPAPGHPGGGREPRRAFSDGALGPIAKPVEAADVDALLEQIGTKEGRLRRIA